jgi:hypothetical protein
MYMNHHDVSDMFWTSTLTNRSLSNAPVREITVVYYSANGLLSNTICQGGARPDSRATYLSPTGRYMRSTGNGYPQDTSQINAYQSLHNVHFFDERNRPRLPLLRMLDNAQRMFHLGRSLRLTADHETKACEPMVDPSRPTKLCR